MKSRWRSHSSMLTVGLTEVAAMAAMAEGLAVAAMGVVVVVEAAV